MWPAAVGELLKATHSPHLWLGGSVQLEVLCQVAQKVWGGPTDYALLRGWSATISWTYTVYTKHRASQWEVYIAAHLAA